MRRTHTRCERNQVDLKQTQCNEGKETASEQGRDTESKGARYCCSNRLYLPTHFVILCVAIGAHCTGPRHTTHEKYCILCGIKCDIEVLLHDESTSVPMPSPCHLVIRVYRSSYRFPLPPFSFSIRRSKTYTKNRGVFVSN